MYFLLADVIEKFIKEHLKNLILHFFIVWVYLVILGEVA